MNSRKLWFLTFLRVQSLKFEVFLELYFLYLKLFVLLHKFIEMLTFKTIPKVRKCQLIAFFGKKKKTLNQNSKLCKKTLYLSDIPHIFE